MIENFKKEIILASNSPRRKDFFNLFKFPFKIKTFDVEETYPSNLKEADIARYIAGLKSNPFKKIINKNQIVISADTIVWHENKCLGKPKSLDDAKQMLKSLSGKTHKVITAVGFLTFNNYYCIDVTTEVTFEKLNNSIIDDYLLNASPLDKAGSYAIQESIGLLGISKINGSYTNVVGLPVTEVLNEIKKLIDR
jgi:septum formation protein|tara:strand:- start:2499 stop:3083 length:585 start_codon:yes stop_codon:yes gene_type:complete